MNKIVLYSLLCSLFLFSSCKMFEMDNYDEPAETVWGEVVDEATGKRVLTDQGSEGVRVRLTELSWGDNVQHNPDFYCMMDGTFQNTKVFKGEYNVRIDGPLFRWYVKIWMALCCLMILKIQSLRVQLS